MTDQAGAQVAEDIAVLSFDDALLELQRTVAELEQGGLPLERSIALYERGVALHERCAALLGEAELRVQKLLERSSGALEAVAVRAAEAADQE
ncbi:MAG: exodeoxyribonuclease VII small subunit [Candidatus Limnocylindrales bacterium]